MADAARSAHSGRSKTRAAKASPRIISPFHPASTLSSRPGGMRTVVAPTKEATLGEMPRRTRPSTSAAVLYSANDARAVAGA